MTPPPAAARTPHPGTVSLPMITPCCSASTDNGGERRQNAAGVLVARLRRRGGISLRRTMEACVPAWRTRHGRARPSSAYPKQLLRHHRHRPLHDHGCDDRAQRHATPRNATPRPRATSTTRRLVQSLLRANEARAAGHRGTRCVWGMPCALLWRVLTNSSLDTST